MRVQLILCFPNKLEFMPITRHYKRRTGTKSKLNQLLSRQVMLNE